MRIRAASIPLTAALLATTACSSTPDPAACKAAMHTQYEQAKTTGTQGVRPAACDGVDDATLQRLAGEVVTEQLNGDQLEADLNRLGREIDSELGTSPSP